MDLKKGFDQEFSKVSSKFNHMSDEGKEDISILKLINYNLLFFIPLLLCLLLSLWLGNKFSSFFEASPAVVSRILMIYLTMVVFFFIVPYIRKREKVQGVRYSIFAFFLVGIGITLPSALGGNFSFFSNLLIYFGSYTLITFFISPDVLGIEKNIQQWFEHHKQLNIVGVFLVITFLYIFGFASTYYAIYTDPSNPNTFNLGFDKKADFGTFVYYSFVTFATVGYGDISPLSTAARVTASTHILLSTVVNVLFIAIILVFVSSAQASSETASTAAAIKEIESKEAREFKKEAKVIEQVGDEIKKVEKKEESDIKQVYSVVDELRKI
jgi:voltage-gated potassium channel Kch